jgi:hypothetical protein
MKLNGVFNMNIYEYISTDDLLGFIEEYLSSKFYLRNLSQASNLINSKI